MSYGSPAGGEGQVRIPRCRGWTALAPECSAGCLCSACSVQKQPVFFTATSLASPASSRHFLSEEKNNQGLIIPSGVVLNLPASVPSERRGKNTSPGLGEKGKVPSCNVRNEGKKNSILRDVKDKNKCWEQEQRQISEEKKEDSD